MKKEIVKISFDLDKAELAALNQLAKRLKLTRSKLIRTLLFLQIDSDNLKWLLPLSKKKGVSVWVYCNVILRTFKRRCLQADADKNLVLEGS